VGRRSKEFPLRSQKNLAEKTTSHTTTKYETGVRLDILVGKRVWGVGGGVFEEKRGFLTKKTWWATTQASPTMAQE